MRLALVTETYPPEINGVAMTLDRLARGLVSRGHEVQVIRPRQHDADIDSHSDGLAQVVVPGIGLPRYQGLHAGLPCKGRLIQLWGGDARPTVVHVATEGPLGWSALRAANRLDLPVASSFHTNFHAYFRHYGAGLLKTAALAYMRHFHNRTRVTMTPSADQRDELMAAGFHNVTVLSRGVDGRLFDPQRRSAELRRAWGAADDTPVVAYVGRIAPEKNIPLAVRAFQAMRQRNPALRFVLVGDGPARAELEKRHGDFLFAGMQRGEDLARHYASADILLFASVTETFGNVVTEGMASGLCVVAYDYAAGRQHIISGTNGLLAPVDDADAFVQAALGAASDPQHARAIGQAARQTALTITWDAIITRFEDLLTRAASDAQPVLA
ncbi:MAG: glycosyltransferase family 1 protein [Phycisphaeraceae bacterium]